MPYIDDVTKACSDFQYGVNGTRDLSIHAHTTVAVSTDSLVMVNIPILQSDFMKIQCYRYSVRYYCDVNRLPNKMEN